MRVRLSCKILETEADVSKMGPEPIEKSVCRKESIADLHRPCGHRETVSIEGFPCPIRYSCTSCSLFLGNSLYSFSNFSLELI